MFRLKLAWSFKIQTIIWDRLNDKNQRTDVINMLCKLAFLELIANTDPTEHQIFIWWMEIKVWDPLTQENAFRWVPLTTEW